MAMRAATRPRFGKELVVQGLRQGIFASPTLAEHMARHGRTSGFDYLRIALALSIVLWHGISISYGQAVELSFWHGWSGLVMHAVLPMFFVLSGFLVAGSLDRCPTLVSFFGLRVLRIVPALAVEVVLSALIFGPLLTRHALADYWGDPRLWRYFLNVLGEIHFVLPGVFEGNPVPDTVNAQLWTIPFELQCYLALGALTVGAVLRRRAVLLAVAVAGQALWACEAIRRGGDGGSGGASGAVLVVSFLVGITAYLYRDRLRLSGALFLAMLAASAILSALPHGSYYLPLPIAYVTIYLGLQTPPRLRVLERGDYSYGIYLYGYPIQQAVASFGDVAQHWWINIALALPATLLLAVLSWHIVERPALGLRRYLPRIESALTARLFRRSVARGTSMIAARPTAPPLSVAGGLGAAATACGLAGTLLMLNADGSLAVLAVLGSFVCALGCAMANAASASGRPIAGPLLAPEH